MKSSNLQLGIGTGSGTLLSALAFMGTHDALRTAALAAIGAVVSFAVSWALQQLREKRNDSNTRAVRAKFTFFKNWLISHTTGKMDGLSLAI